MIFRLSIITGLALTLSGCAFTYDLEAHIVNGYVTFDVREGSYSWPQRVDCIRSIEVVTDAATDRAPSPRKATEGRSHTAWLWQSPDPSGPCLAGLPIRYGIVPAGATNVVAAERLIPGAIYDVQSGSPGGGYGQGRFRLTDAMTVENIAIQ